MAAAPEVCYRHQDRPTRVHCTRCGRPICPDCMTPAPVGHHCPECLADARRDARRIRGPVIRVRSVTMLLLAINLAVFALDLVFLALGAGAPLLRRGEMVPLRVAGGEPWRLLTAMFLHFGIVHLAFNSLALLVFGRLVEDTFGRARTIALYLLTGFAASVASFALGPPHFRAVGASGAIFGLLGVWLAYNVRRRSLSLARSNVQTALLLIGVNLLFGFTVPGIDNTAHIGGLVVGVAAGFLAEGAGRGRVRLVSQVVGLTSIGIVAVAVAAWRISQLSPLT